MAETRISISRAAGDILPKLGPVAFLSGLLIVGGLIWSGLPLGAALLSAGGALAIVGIVVFAAGAEPWLRHRRLDSAFASLSEVDPAAIFVTTTDGLVEFCNPAAQRQGLAPGAAAAEALNVGSAAAPAVLGALMTQAARQGTAEHRLAGPRGTVRIRVHRIRGGRLLWRTEAQTCSPIAEGTTLPALLAAPDGTIVARNEALVIRLGQVPARIDDILDSPPLKPGRRQYLAGQAIPHDAVLSSRVRPDGLTEVFLLDDIADASDPDEALIERLPVPLLVIDAKGDVAMANQPARRLLAVAEARGQAFADLVEGLGRPVSEWLADALSGRGANRPEVVRATHPTTDLYLQITLGSYRGGEEAHLVAVLHDATELKTLEAQFVQSQKMQAIGQLAGGVAHDFNNLLTAISGHCDLLLLRHAEDDPDYADLEQINQNANRAASLVGQLLAFSRKQNLRPELLDLRDTLADLTHLLNRLVGEKVALSFEHDPALQLVRADKRQLEQVIMNLVVNARDAMPQGGPIRIETKMRRLEAALSRDRAEVPPGEYVMVTVTDTGHGIPPDKLPKIFEPFFTTKKTGEGTGLGLSTAYGIVKQTGGYIFADSRVGEGTEFSLLFPAHLRRAPEAIVPPSEAVAAAPAVANGGDGVILLVEDEAPVRAFAARALRLRGHEVIEAANAEAALEILSDTSLKVDVFVTDVIMPGMDGPSWVREALQARPDTRVVFVSGYAEESFSDNQARIPNSVFLPKPFSLVELTTTVQKQLLA